MRAQAPESRYPVSPYNVQTMNGRLILAFVALCAVATFGMVWEVSAKKPRDAETTAQSLSAMKQLALGAIMYSADYDDRLPSATSVTGVHSQIYPYIKTGSFWHTEEDGDILFNSALSGVRLGDLENLENTVLFFGSHPHANGRRYFSTADGSSHISLDSEWMRHYHLNPVFRPAPTAKAASGPRHR